MTSFQSFLSTSSVEYFRTPTSNNYFFGYYDKYQLNYNSSRLLALRVSHELSRLPCADDTVEIGFFDISPRWFNFPCSIAYLNLQLAARIYALLVASTDNCIIYNDLIDGNFRSVKLDINRNIKTILDFPIYTLSHCGSLYSALTTSVTIFVGVEETVHNPLKNTKIIPVMAFGFYP